MMRFALLAMVLFTAGLLLVGVGLAIENPELIAAGALALLLSVIVMIGNG